MRDFEHSRSRHHAHQKAKEAEKRERKRITQRKKTYANFSNVSEEENILICSGNSSNRIFRRPFSGKRTRSLDAMEVDTDQSTWSSARHTSFCSSPNTHYSTGPTEPHSDEDGSNMVEDEISVFPSILAFSDPAPSLSNSTCESATSSYPSLSLPQRHRMEFMISCVWDHWAHLKRPLLLLISHCKTERGALAITSQSWNIRKVSRPEVTTMGIYGTEWYTFPPE